MDARYLLVEQWPKSNTGQPILKDSNQALVFAQLICDNDHVKDLLNVYVEDIRIKLSAERSSENPDLDHMMVLACRAQFYHDCLDECLRINAENHGK